MSYSIKYFASSPEIDEAFDKKALSMNGKKIDSRTYVFDDIIRASDFADLGHEVYIGMERITQRIVDGEEYDLNYHWGAPIEQDFSAAKHAKSNNLLVEMLKSADNDLHEADVIDHDCLFHPLYELYGSSTDECPEEYPEELTEQPDEELTEQPEKKKKKKSFWRKLF